MSLVFHPTANFSLFNLAIFLSKTCKNLFETNKEVRMKIYQFITIHCYKPPTRCGHSHEDGHNRGTKHVGDL
jgi:hypothetical protein